MNASRKVIAAAATAVAVVTALSSAHAATQQDVSKARAECAAQKQRVRAMEGSSAAESVAAARKEWENACQRAELLINEMNGTKLPEPAAAPEPAPAPAEPTG